MYSMDMNNICIKTYTTYSVDSCKTYCIRIALKGITNTLCAMLDMPFLYIINSMDMNNICIKTYTTHSVDSC